MLESLLIPNSRRLLLSEQESEPLHSFNTFLPPQRMKVYENILQSCPSQVYMRYAWYQSQMSDRKVWNSDDKESTWNTLVNSAQYNKEEIVTYIDRLTTMQLLFPDDEPFNYLVKKDVNQIQKVIQQDSHKYGIHDTLRFLINIKVLVPDLYDKLIPSIEKRWYSVDTYLDPYRENPTAESLDLIGLARVVYPQHMDEIITPSISSYVKERARRIKQGKDSIVVLDPETVRNWGILEHLRTAFWQSVIHADDIEVDRRGIHLITQKSLSTKPHSIPEGRIF